MHGIRERLAVRQPGKLAAPRDGSVIEEANHQRQQQRAYFKCRLLICAGTRRYCAPGLASLPESFVTCRGSIAVSTEEAGSGALMLLSLDPREWMARWFGYSVVASSLAMTPGLPPFAWDHHLVITGVSSPPRLVSTHPSRGVSRDRFAAVNPKLNHCSCGTRYDALPKPAWKVSRYKGGRGWAGEPRLHC